MPDKRDFLFQRYVQKSEVSVCGGWWQLSDRYNIYFITRDLTTICDN
jgi:hypothetical protein